MAFEVPSLSASMCRSDLEVAGNPTICAGAPTRHEKVHALLFHFVGGRPLSLFKLRRMRENLSYGIMLMLQCWFVSVHMWNVKFIHMCSCVFDGRDTLREKGVV